MKFLISQEAAKTVPDPKILQTRRHWIFDLDGTLTVSAHDFEHMRRELGLAPETPILEALHAMPQEQALQSATLTEVGRHFGQLPERHRLVLKLRFGLGGAVNDEDLRAGERRGSP